MAARRNKRAEYLVTRFGIFDGPVDSEAATEELVMIGARAVPTLIEALSDQTNGWQAAMTLAEIGAPAARAAIPALITYAQNPKANSQMWSARALGRMGRLDELFALARRKATRYASVKGLAEGRPTSYPLLDQLLSRNDDQLTQFVVDALRPGSAMYDPSSTDHAALVEASTSSYVAIRKDVACALGSFRTAADRIRSVPVLVAMLSDRSSEVRRLAVLALGWCRGHARPVIAQVRAMQRDRVKAVRETATAAMLEISKRR